MLWLVRARVGQVSGNAVDVLGGRAGEQAAVVFGRPRQVAGAQRVHVTAVHGAQVAGQEFGDLLLVEQGVQGGGLVTHGVTLQLTE
jgi:hypothetical protein